MQCVRVNGYTSSFLPINQGIPQGTIIGPLLFLLFIDDISLYIQNSNIDIYADDGSLTSCSKWNDISQVNNNIQGDLDNIQRCAIMKKIAFNEKDLTLENYRSALANKVPKRIDPLKNSCNSLICFLE